MKPLCPSLLCFFVFILQSSLRFTTKLEAIILSLSKDDRLTTVANILL